MFIYDVTPDSVVYHGLYCIKNVNDSGYHCKLGWFNKRYKEGLRLKVIKDENDKPLGFIEYIPAEYAWRPVVAPNYMFIHCIAVYSKKDRLKGVGKLLIDTCISDAIETGKKGVCVTTSKGSWLASKDIYEKYGFVSVDKKDRFELHCLSFKDDVETPNFPQWDLKRVEYQGWHLIYADQCPWHDKSVNALQKIAVEMEIPLNIYQLKDAKDAQSAPTGYGVFSLIKDGKELADHYISATRFKNILKKELTTT